ncbi:MAG TPA: hypothetical protein DCS93_21690 [Microscillaceae bacterium]|nr:hypothetical protein [Microscillaceae bacterium]
MAKSFQKQKTAANWEESVASGLGFELCDSKDLRRCLNVVFEVKNDEFFGLMQHIFKGIARAIAAKIAKIRA